MPVPFPQDMEIHACSRVLRCAGPKDSVQPVQQIYQPLGCRELVLRQCLALDDASLSWVCAAISNARPGMVLEAKSSPLSPKTAPLSPSFSPTKGEGQGPTLLAQECNVKAVSIERKKTEELDEFDDLAVKSCQLGSLDDCDAMQQSILARDVELWGEPPPTLTPIVQFLSSMAYCREEDPTVEVTIVRIGAVDKQSSVRYETHDISAKAGVKYTPQSGTLVFKPGERLKMIYIPTTNDEAWDATLEFEVVLLDEGLEHAQLGRYLWTTRVKIIDDDYFPTNRFSKLMDNNEFQKISTPILMWEYFKMNYRNRVVRRGLHKILWAAQIGNVYFIMCLFLSRWMIDYVLCESTCDTESASGKLLLISCLTVIPFPLMHYLEYAAVFWKVGGASRMTLQANLLRKYLAYDEASLAQIDQSKLIMAMTRDAADIVEHAFCKIPVLITCLIRLALLLAYQILIPVILGIPMGSPSELIQRFAPTLIFPVVMVMFLKLRNPRTLYYLEKQKRAQNDMLIHIRKTIDCFSLIRDYRKRGAFVDQFVARVSSFNSCDVASRSIQVNNRKFAEWCSTIICAGYTQFGGLQVAGGAKLGAFLNTLAIYKALGEMWGQVYEVLLDMQNVFDALTTMVEYLNLPTEVFHRMEHYERNMALFRGSMQTHLEHNKWPGLDPVDEARIELRNLSFIYKSKGHIGNALQSSTAALAQGALYAMVGPPSQGKGTVLRLLGEVLIPYYKGFERNCDGGGGDLVIPTHLRALHVSKDPMFVEGSLRYNLTFGCGRKTDDGRLDRVIAICKLLHVPDYLIEAVEQDGGQEYEWGNLLSSTDAALLHVARALITNPEILCIHKPALFLNNEMSDNVYRVLKEFVSHRGLQQDPKEFYHRRPRTCVVTARRVQGPASEVADAVFEVTRKSGMKFVSVAGEHIKRTKASRMGRTQSERTSCISSVSKDS